MNALRTVASRILKLQQDKNGDYIYFEEGDKNSEQLVHAS